MFGGGLRHFIPQGQTGSVRTDNIDVLTNAAELGYTVSLDRASFDSILPVKGSFPVLGLYALSDLDFELDRNPATQPSLVEMAEKALGMLLDATKGTTTGFFIMIEGSRIDHAAHANDAAAHYGDIEMYQQTVDMVKRFVDANVDTMMISVSDHECGGLTVGRGNGYIADYLWYPEVLDGVKSSTGVVSKTLRSYMGNPNQTEEYVAEVLATSLGIVDGTAEEMSAILVQMTSTNSTAEQYLTYQLSGMINTRALLGWTTYGHTAVDVNLYAYGTYSGMLRGNVENTEIGEFIVEALGLDLQDVVLDANL